MSNMKHCPHCHCSTEVIRFGVTSSDKQRYRCKQCKSTWTNKSRKRRLTDKIWHDFVWNNQTVEMLSKTYHKHPNTIRTIIHNYQPETINLASWSKKAKQAVKVVIMDTTYFGRNLGVITIIDAYTGHLLYFQPIKRSEVIQDYIDGLETIRKTGLYPEVCGIDGRKGLINAMEYRGLKVQVCLFHKALFLCYNEIRYT